MGIPLDELSGSGDTKALHATVEKFAKVRQGEWTADQAINLADVGNHRLNGALVFAVDVQIYLAVTSAP